MVQEVFFKLSDIHIVISFGKFTMCISLVWVGTGLQIKQFEVLNLNKTPYSHVVSGTAQV